MATVYKRRAATYRGSDGALIWSDGDSPAWAASVASVTTGIRRVVFPNGAIASTNNIAWLVGPYVNAKTDAYRNAEYACYVTAVTTTYIDVAFTSGINTALAGDFCVELFFSEEVP